MSEITIPTMTYKDLFEPYTRDGHTLEASIKFLVKEAKLRDIPIDLVDLAVQEVMMEVQNGRDFPLDHCLCGCGIDKSGTAITHEMLSRLRELDWNLQAELSKFWEQRANMRIASYVQRQKAWKKQEKKRLKREKRASKKNK